MGLPLAMFALFRFFPGLSKGKKGRVTQGPAPAPADGPGGREERAAEEEEEAPGAGAAGANAGAASAHAAAETPGGRPALKFVFRRTPQTDADRRVEEEEYSA